MRKWKTRGLAALAACACLTLTGCTAVVDESVLNTQADYSVDINMPYATATPLPDHLNVPDPIVVDAEGKVSVNDVTAIEGDFQSQQARQAEYQSLTLGSTGAEVQALQARLEALGYFSGEVSGVYDAATEEAVKRFERTYGTMQTGVATSKLQLKLFAAGAPAYGSEEYENAVVAQYSVLRAGNVGSSVYALQRRLKELGYPVGELNGVFNDQTAQAVALFYTAYGLASSQVASVSMQQKLYAEDAIAFDPNTVMPHALDQAETADLPAGEDSEALPAEMLDNTPTPEPQSEEDAFAALVDATPTPRVEESVGLGPGSIGPLVEEIQKRLIELGYMEEDSATGVYDILTREAVDRFLLMNGESSEGGVLTREQQELILGEPISDIQAQTELLTSLDYGDSGAAVIVVQNRLIELGYAVGTADGKYGSSTIESVRAFQQINDLNADGRADAETLNRLYSVDAISYEEGREKLERLAAETTPVPDVNEFDERVFYNLHYGSVGNAVQKLQQRLNRLGYLGKGGITSNYDENTVTAVKKYQKAIGVPQTGDATASFQLYLYSDAAPNKNYRLHSSTQDYETLSVGSSGEAVERLQQRLAECGMLSADDLGDDIGLYNEATYQAVVRAQVKMGYSVADGEASIEFQAFLYSRYGAYLSTK